MNFEKRQKRVANYPPQKTVVRSHNRALLKSALDMWHLFIFILGLERQLASKVVQSSRENILHLSI